MSQWRRCGGRRGAGILAQSTGLAQPASHLSYETVSLRLETWRFYRASYGGSSENPPAPVSDKPTQKRWEGTEAARAEISPWMTHAMANGVAQKLRATRPGQEYPSL